MRISHKLILGFTAIALLLGLVGYVSLIQLNKIARPLHEDIPESVKAIAYTSHLDGLAQFIRYYDEILTQSARNYAFTEDKKWKQRYKDVEPKLDDMIKEAIAEGDQKDKEIFSNVDKANLALVEMEYKSIALVDNRQAQQAAEILESNAYWYQKKIYEQGLKGYVHRRGIEYDETLLSSTITVDAATKQAQDLTRLGIRFIFIFFVAVLLLAIGAGLYISRSIYLPIAKLEDATVEIGKGRLDTKIEITSKDEIGVLARSFDAMVSNLKETTASRDALNSEITERRQAEETLAKSEARYREIVKNTLDMIYTLDRAGRFTFVSPSVARILKYNPKELLGQNAKMVIAPEYWEKSRLAFQRRLKGKHVPAYEFELVTSEGVMVPVEINSNPIYDTEGEIIGTQAVLRDIRDRKQAQEERARLQQELFQAQKMESIGMLAGGIAHDFNNLLQGILGYVQLMKIRMDENDPNCAELNLIDVAAEKAADLTQQLLSYARKGKYMVEPVAIGELVDQVLSLLERTFDKNIVIKTEISTEVPYIKVNAGQIHQMLFNLCINARDAMPDGGELTVTAEEVEINEKYCSSHPEALPEKAAPGKYVCLGIRDTGSGMDEETRTKIFEPFFTTKEVGKGTGLGLSMVYGVVQNHGGHIEVESAPGDGAVFRVFLPAMAERGSFSDRVEPTISKLTLSKQSAIEKRRDDTGERKRILVVDDEEIVRFLAIDLLKSLGYEVLSASDGREAIEIFEKDKDSIDLVLLDMVMPRQGGVETFRKIKKIDPSASIILSSGYTKDRPTRELLDEGACGFLQKPYKLEELAGIVRLA